MATITSSSFAKALWPGVNAWYGAKYDIYEVEYDKIFDKNSSDRAWEEDVGQSLFGLLQVKQENSPVTFQSARQGFTTRYTHVVYAGGFTITREMYEDDQYGVIGKRKAESLANSARQTKETVGANILNRAFNTSYTFGDGKRILSNDHPNIAGGTWSNVLSTAADISEVALEQAFIDIAGFTFDAGLKMALKPVGLVVPKELDFEVNKILKTEYEVGTNNNTVNVIRGRFPTAPVINHWLTDTDAWFVKTSADNGLKYFERRADEFTMDNDWDSENAKYKVTGRYSFGVSDVRSLYGSPGA